MDLEKAVKFINKLEKGSPYLEEKGNMKLLAAKGDYRFEEVCIPRSADKIRVVSKGATIEEYSIINLEKALRLFFRVSETSR
jgi:hypothetical protein